jgi:hypothetical protein
MSQLGPITGNRFSGSHQAALKPHLQARLAAEVVRSAHGGLMLRGGNGRLSFVPGGLPPLPMPVVPRRPPTPPTSPAEGDDERQTMTSGPAFEPYGEPLALGDTVQGMDGRIGRVSFIAPHRLGVAFEGGNAWCCDMVWRASFRLLAKAGA